MSALTCHLHAATPLWNGGNSTVWNDPLNWSSAPAPGDSLVFRGSTGLSNTNDFATDTAFAGITFDATAGAFVLGGNRIVLGTSDTILNNSASTQVINFDVKLTPSTSRSVTINTAAGDVIMNGIFKDTTANQVYNVVKSGTGTLTLTNNGSAPYVGVAVDAGVLKLGSSNAVGGILKVASSAGVSFAAGIGNFTVGNLQSGGGIALVDEANQAVNLTLNRAANSPIYDGKLTGLGSLTIDKVDDRGGTYLGGANTYSGGTQILKGKLAARNASALGSGAVFMGSQGVLLVGADLSIAALSGSSGAVIQAENGAVTRTLTVNTAEADNDFAGVLKDGVTAGNLLALTKAGTGTLRLNGGSHTYTGATKITGGTLIVDGSIASSSGVSVATGAALGGSGRVSTIGGAGTVTPGEGGGILEASSVDASGGLGFAFEFTRPSGVGGSAPDYAAPDASGNDVLRLTGSTPFQFSLTSANSVVVDFSGLTVQAGDVYKGGFFVDGSSDFLAAISDAAFSYLGLESGLYVQLSTIQETADFGSGLVDGYITQFTVVPEGRASMLCLAGGGLLLLLALRRSRRGRATGC